MKAIRSIKKFLIIFAASALLIITAAVHVYAGGVAFSSAQTGEEGSLVITVVENIPAADIEENAVPLAIGSRGSGFSTWYIVLAAAILIFGFFVIRYIVKRNRLKRIFAPYADELKETPKR